MTPQTYAVESMKQPDLEEYMFPLWDSVYQTTVDLINSRSTDREDMDSILTAMAIDNETEDILGYISENGCELFIEKLVEAGAGHLQPNARWQCAELIRRRRPQNGDRVLKILLSDEDEYVVKRAKNAIMDKDADCDPETILG